MAERLPGRTSNEALNVHFKLAEDNIKSVIANTPSYSGILGGKKVKRAIGNLATNLMVREICKLSTIDIQSGTSDDKTVVYTDRFLPNQGEFVRSERTVGRIEHHSGYTLPSFIPYPEAEQTKKERELGGVELLNIGLKAINKVAEATQEIIDSNK